MPQFSKSSTSAIRLILGFQGVLGIVAAGVAYALPSGRVVHSGSFRSRQGNVDFQIRVFISSDTRATMQQFWKVEW